MSSPSKAVDVRIHLARVNDCIAAHALDVAQDERWHGILADHAKVSAAVAELIAENGRIARHLEEAVAFIEKVYPDAKHLDSGPVLRNMRRWASRLRAALSTIGESP